MHGTDVTALHAQLDDLFVERLNPDAPEEYETPDGFRTFETRRSILRIKDKELFDSF